MTSKYYDNWKSRGDVDYNEVKAMPEDDIIYAGYTYEAYSGNAIVVFVKDGKIFENNDGHCSCNGLESWKPEETSIEALRLRKGWPGLQEALDARPPLSTS